MDALLLRARAKVNLALSVGPPEAARGGLHPIASWFVTIELADDVRLKQGEGAGSVHRAAPPLIEWAADAPCRSEIDWSPDDDLAVRAIQMLGERAGRPLPAVLEVRKRIPVGGGLGGGSADAAAALIGANALFGLRSGGDALRAVGLRLGSDVPFFLDEVEQPHAAPRPALVGGMGERIERTERVRGDLVLIAPPFGCPTGAVYRAFDESPTAGVDEVRVRELIGAGIADGRLAPDAPLFNDLAEPAMRVQPRLREARDRAVEATGRPIHVTGSGSTMFAIAGPGEAGELAEVLRSALPEASIIATRLA